MEKIQTNNTPKASLIVNVTPDQLRVIADRLEHQARSILPGQEITYDFTRSVSLVFSPEVSTERYLTVSTVVEAT